MIDLERFTVGLGTVAVQLGLRLETPTLKAFHQALEDETTPDEWEAFCRIAAKRYAERLRPQIRVPELLDCLRDFRGEHGNTTLAIQSEAIQAYERVLQAGTYTPEGTTWFFRTVREKCGQAAAEAFLAAGGASAFETVYHGDARRAAFVAAYQLAAREVPASRLLAEGPKPLALPAAAQPPSEAEAEKVLARLERDPQVVEAHARALKAKESRRMTDADWDARVAELREQGRAMGVTDEMLAAVRAEREAERQRQAASVVLVAPSPEDQREVHELAELVVESTK